MGVPVYRTASTLPQYTDILVYRYTPTELSMKNVGYSVPTVSQLLLYRGICISHEISSLAPPTFNILHGKRHAPNSSKNVHIVMNSG